ncbi:MAG: serine/threonine protein kinase [Polyangiaceae bacterium]|nr:serine/threonine protein kinase [Polyangiaceae bacterium]
MPEADERPVQSGTVEIVTSTTDLTPELSSAMTLLGSEPVAIEQPPDALVGTTLSGNYKVLRVIGEGGMGRVYEAQHTRIAGKRFAIKLLHAEFARQPGILARFQREAEASASISHPNVVGVYDVDRTPDGQPFMVSELLAGQDLSKLLESQERITVKQAVIITRQVCRALQAAHDKGVIHRDVKPENVFITGALDEPTAKVLDFGISRLQNEGSSSLTKTGMVIGTPAYMAPEQAMGGQVDARVDVYGVGAILYRTLTGRLPYGDEEPTVTIAKLLTTEPERPRQVAPEIPESLEMIIQKAMAREPDRRYQTLQEMERALGAFEAQLSSAAVQGAAGSGAVATTDGEIAAARPQLFLEIATAVVVAIFGLLGVLNGAIRLGRGIGLSKLEFALALLALLGLFGTPLALLVRYIKKTIWPDTNRVVELASRFRMPLLTALAVTGMLSVFIHVLEGVSGAGTGAGWAIWEMLIPVVGALAAAIAFSWRRIGPKLPFSRAGGNGSHILGGALALEFIVVLVLVLAHREPVKEVTPASLGTDEAPRIISGSGAPKPGAAPSVAEMAPGNAQTAKPSSGLPLSSPEAKDAWRKLDDLMRKRLAKESVEALDELLTVDPLAPQDKEVRGKALQLAVDVALLRNDSSEKMLQLLSTRMGSIGIDLMYELVATRGGSVAARDAERLLREDAVRARGTEAFRIAYDLRIASGCDAKRALFERARTQGDGRAAMELKLLRECRRGNTCCMRGDDALNDLIAAIEKKAEQ